MSLPTKETGRVHRYDSLLLFFFLNIFWSLADDERTAKWSFLFISLIILIKWILTALLFGWGGRFT
jgi:hypothetical protein